MSPPDGAREAHTVAQAMVQELVDAGATHVFGGHGAAVIPLIEAIVEHPRLKWVYTRNEGGAALAGAAAAKLAAPAGIGVVLATSGPGATNLTTGLIAAAKDNLPLVAVTGLKPSYKSGLTDFQDLEISRLFSGALSFSRRVMHPLQAPQLMRDALAHALTQRTAVHLAIPEDIQQAMLQPEQQLQAQGLLPALRALHATPASGEAIRQAVEFLTKRRRARMLIAIGHLAVEEGPQITALAEQLNAPMVTRLDAKGTVDESHPLCLGVVGVHGNPGLEVSRDIVESADIIISCGVEDQMLGQLVLTDGMQVKDLVLIQPDMANFSARFSLGAALVGNLGGSLSALLIALKEEDSKGEKPDLEDEHLKSSGRASSGGEEQFPITLAWDHFIEGHWRQRSDGATRPFLVTETAKLEDSAFCHPSHIYAALNTRLGPDDTLAVDVGDQTLWAAMLGHLTRGTRTLSDEFMGTMGYALPAAIAASLLRPAGTHVAVAGDGAFQMTLNELATAVQHGCRVVAVVFCNQSLGRVKYGFGAQTIVGADIGNPDFVALARAFGAEGVRVSSPDEAEGAIRAAWEAKGVFVVEVAVDPSLSAEMAKMHDMRSVAALARRVGDLLPESLAGLRRPQAMQGLMEHVREKHRTSGGEGASSPALTESDVEAIRGMLERWRTEYADLGNQLERQQSGLSRFVMQKIHKLRSTQCSPGTCGCWEPTNRGEAEGAQPPVELTKGEIATTEGAREGRGFPGPYPAQLLLKEANVDVGDGEAFASKWATAVGHLFDAKPHGRAEWEEFLDGGLSNGRAMRWDLMTIAPKQSFPLHAHANIEAIYVAKGTLLELRLCGPIPTTHFVDDASGHPLPPDLSDRSATFERLTFPVGSFLVNDVGSVHQSYTEEEGAVLLLLWGGCHANITPSHMPKKAYENGFREVKLKAGPEPNPSKQEEGSE